MAPEGAAVPPPSSHEFGVRQGVPAQLRTQLPNGNAQAVCPEVPQPQDAAAVGHDDGADVCLRGGGGWRSVDGHGRRLRGRCSARGGARMARGSHDRDLYVLICGQTLQSGNPRCDCQLHDMVDAICVGLEALR